MLASRVMSQRPNSYLMPDSPVPATNTMLQLVTSLLLLAAAYGCGVPNYLPNARVVNGVDAAPHSWPWQASLQVERPGYYQHSCGGSLITSRWVLSAAHCLTFRANHRVVLGEHDRDVEEGSEQYFSIRQEDIFIHPLWDDYHPENGYDIALVKLPREAELNDKVKLGCLPPTGRQLYNNLPCIAPGWGTVYSNGPQAIILQQAILPVVDYEHCSQPDWLGADIDPSLLCAGGFGQDLCNSDSGGPLNCKAGDGRWYIEGITSFGLATCNTPKKPTVFTRVSLFNDWIDEIIANN